MGSKGQDSSRASPLVRTHAAEFTSRKGNVLDYGKRSQHPQLTLITPVAHAKVASGLGSSPFERISSAGTSQLSSIWSKDYHADYDDDLYNLTDDDSVEVPLIASDSVKKQAAKGKSRYPALIIPSPDQWPMPPTATRPMVATLGISPVSNLINSTRLAALTVPAKAPSRTSTPSLDGSITSEEFASATCPSTPEGVNYSPEPEDWDPPAQLNADAYAVLCQLAASYGRRSPSSSRSNSPPIPQEAFDEMREIARECDGRRQRRTLAGGELAIPVSSEPVSALTIPSPSTFFGSLNTSTRQTWCVGGTPPPPSTGTAERFYRLPWRSDSPQMGRRLRIDTSQEPRPVAARKDSAWTIPEGIEATEITDSAFVGPSQQDIDPNLERTRRWLYSQFMWMTNASAETTPADRSRSYFSPETPSDKSRSVFSPETPQRRPRSCSFPETPPPSTPTTTASPFTNVENTPSSKKSVRLLESVPEGEEPDLQDRPQEIEPLFFEGFRYATSRFKSRDAFRHSQARAEASHMLSSTLPSRHSALLLGEFKLGDMKPPSPPPPGMMIDVEDQELKKNVACAERERQALEQLMPSVWELNAARQVFGSQLMASPIAEQLKSRTDMRILDYGGGSSCDWGWAVALKYPNSAVFTVPSSPTQPPKQLSGPLNHCTVRANSTIALPFPDNHFDLISARSLYAIMRTYFPDMAAHPGQDEYDLVLQEFMRVLKPGGFLEFHLMDAEMLHPGPLGSALGAEFASTLRHRGYDPQASRYFLPRLRNAGFDNIKRAWLVLPAANVVPRWVDRGKISSPEIGIACSTPGTVFSRATGHRRQDSAFSVGSPSRQLPDPPLVGSTNSVRAMTGLVGARAWERWIVTLQREVQGDEEGMLSRINRALEESGRAGAGWKCLVGWARKTGGG